VAFKQMQNHKNRALDQIPMTPNVSKLNKIAQ